MYKFRCSACGATVEGEHAPPSHQCSCGATSTWCLTLGLDDKFEAKENLTVMDGPTKRKSRYLMESKDDFDGDLQRPSVAERTYDRDGDVYRERIIVDGKIKVSKDERLSEHRSANTLKEE